MMTFTADTFHMMFLSTAFMAAELMPGWLRFVVQGNPVNWAVKAGREAMLGQGWTAVWQYSALLMMFALIGGYLATQAFRTYRRAA